MMDDENQKSAAHLDGDGRTVYTVDGRGRREHCEAIRNAVGDGRNVYLPCDHVARYAREHRCSLAYTVARGRESSAVFCRFCFADVTTLLSPESWALLLRPDVPRVEGVADAEALFGRGAAVIGARGGVAECLAAEAPSVVSVPASRFVVDNRPPPVDLAAENAALREALAASGELLAEAHAEIDRLRGER